MRIRLVSDIHTEAFLNYPLSKLEELFIPTTQEDKSSVLVLAGDICSNLDFLVGFISHIESRFRLVMFVGGNHEYYRNDWDNWNTSAKEKLSTLKNTIYVTDDTKEFYVDTTRFILSTLWADGGFTLSEKHDITYSLNDFRIITNGKKLFTVPDMIRQYMKNKLSIETILMKPWCGKTVVVTHHLPSRTLVSDRFLVAGSDGINGGFVGACDDLIEKYSPDLWLFGHTHDSISKMLYNTKCVANPAGYRGEWYTQYNSFMKLTADKQIETNPCFIEI